MVHSGYEASGVNYTFGSLKGLLETAKAMFSKYDDEGAQKILNEWQPEGHGQLVQIAAGGAQNAVFVTTSVDSKFSNVAGD
jgi:hypothetical protein